MRRRLCCYSARTPFSLSASRSWPTAALRTCVHITATEGAEIIRKHMARTADDLSTFFFKPAREGFGREVWPEDFAVVVHALRPIGLEVVRVVSGQ